MEPNTPYSPPTSTLEESPSKSGGGRPTSITVICVIGFVGALLSLPVIFSDVAKSIAPWYPIAIGISSAISFVCFCGLWLMKKWAAYAYAAFSVLCQIFMLTTGIWNIMSLVIPGIVIFIALKNIRKMS